MMLTTPDDLATPKPEPKSGLEFQKKLLKMVKSTFIEIFFHQVSFLILYKYYKYTIHVLLTS